jgi:hypothetical protein
VKHIQHPDKHTCNIRLKIRWNIGNRRLQHMCTTIATDATSRSTFATHIWNTCNIPLKHMKHLGQTIKTCAFSKPWQMIGWTGHCTAGSDYVGRGGEGGGGSGHQCQPRRGAQHGEAQPAQRTAAARTASPLAVWSWERTIGSRGMGEARSSCPIGGASPSLAARQQPSLASSSVEEATRRAHRRLISRALRQRWSRGLTWDR